MLGYWNNEDQTNSTIDAARWIHTEDLATMDKEGYVNIVGRIKDMIIRGGENIYPGEIEAVAYELEAVHECVVFGEPDDAMGEELVMVVYVTPGRQLSEQDLRDWLGNRLAAYKVPRTIVFSPQPLPRNASEKLHKLKVKEAFLASE